jgi:hypothetical protein
MELSPKQYGFNVGYADFNPNRPQVIPPSPYPLDTPERYQWIDGWTAGRHLAKRHHDEKESIIFALEGLHV